MDTDFPPVVFDLSELRNQLWAFHGHCGTWRAVANLDKFKALRAVSKAPHALLRKLAKEPAYYPTDSEICKALGITAYTPVPTCPYPDCPDKVHTHAHGEVVYPAGTLTYDGATQEVKPLVTKVWKTRSPRLIASTNDALYDWVKEYAVSQETTMAEVIRQGMISYKNTHTPITQEQIDYWFSDEVMELMEDDEDD